MHAAAAITRSISHTETVAIEAGPAVIAELKAACEDWASENDGSVDLWGTRDGEEWRVRVTPSETYAQ